ncbi:hypothetical protein VTI28DRAFT_3001 [Corynascus sepedonium]
MSEGTGVQAGDWVLISILPSFPPHATPVTTNSRLARLHAVCSSPENALAVPPCVNFCYGWRGVSALVCVALGGEEWGEAQSTQLRHRLMARGLPTSHGPIPLPRACKPAFSLGELGQEAVPFVSGRLLLSVGESSIPSWSCSKANIPRGSILSLSLVKHVDGCESTPLYPVVGAPKRVRTEKTWPMHDRSTST